ncbi:hypothetical protein LguiB_006440 [Lonicera macranthoides]
MARGAPKFLFLSLFSLLFLSSSSEHPAPPTIVTVNPNPTSPTPVTIPPIIPATSPPVTNPAATQTPPITNPAASFPPPSMTAPGTANSPAGTGGSWCVVKSGAPESKIQAGIDYACGTGGADCSMIQEGGICYNPNSIQNHASYAFNSYYQKNPGLSSCDFGGAAMVTNVNPSVGSCTFPSSSSASSTPTATSSSGGTFPGLGSTDPSLNTSDPAASGTGTLTGDSTPSSSSTISTHSQPIIIAFIILPILSLHASLSSILDV